MQNPANRVVVVLGTGGTIAGRAASASDSVGYRAGEVGVDALIAAVPALAAWPIEAEQVAQLDSKDMDHRTWQRLAVRCAHHLVRDEVAGLVVTHGTDTLEETAWWLHRLLAPADKPLVLTAAMRPATSLQADGPQNLLDAVTVAATPGARGVVAVLAGAVHGAADLRKWHTHRLDAFTSGDAGVLARVEQGRLRTFRDWPRGPALGVQAIAADPDSWPWVAVLPHHAGQDRRAVAALVDAGVRGLVVAGTGNGTVGAELALALDAADRAGVRVLRLSRCASGAVIGAAETDPRSPWQARIDLLLELLEG